MSTAPDTIVLIHGFWVTPRSWEHWITHYEAKGFTVLAPAYPGFDVEVEAINADHSIVEALTVGAIVERYEGVIAALDSPPILIGHSAGGAFTQVLLDHGFGACGVALNSAPTEGVRVLPLSQLKSTFPAFKNPANRHRAVPLDYEHWQYAFTNTFSDERVARALRALPRARLGQDPLGRRAGQLHPRPPGGVGRLQERGPGTAAVRLRQRGPHHAAGRPAIERQALQGQGARSRRSRSTRATPTCSRRRMAGSRSPTTSWTGPCSTRPPDVRLTHVGGPTVLLEVDGLAPADRSDLRPSRTPVRLRLGNVVAQAHRPGGRRSRTSARSTPCSSPTTTTPTTSTTRAGRCSRRSGTVLTTRSGAARLGGERPGPRPLGHRWPSSTPDARRSRSRQPRAATGHRAAARSSAT